MRTHTLALVLLLLLCAHAVPAATIIVDPAGAYPTIRSGVKAAASGDTVLLTYGIYTGPDNRGIDFEGKDLVVRPLYRGASVTIDCEYQDVAFYYRHGETQASRLEEITIKHGSLEAPPAGAILCAAGAEPRFERCVFHQNDGNAVLSNEASPTFTQCVFWDNPYRALCLNGGSGSVDRCIFTQNGSGAALGGAVYCSSALYSFDECVFDQNAGAGAAAVYCRMGSGPGIYNCTFARNTAFPDGSNPPAAIYADDLAFPAIQNSVIATTEGGHALSCHENSYVQTSKCVVFGNAMGDSLCGFHEENLFTDPLFCHPEWGIYTVAENSPCLPANNPWGIEIGAYGWGCDAIVTVEEMSWGRVKDLYR